MPTVSASTALTTSRSGCCSSISIGAEMRGAAISKAQSGRSARGWRSRSPSASCVWFLTAGHGLETETIDTGRVNGANKPIKKKRWTGDIVDDVMRLRLAFICDRALDCSEAGALTLIAEGHGFGLVIDRCISRQVQINYIHPMHWAAGPEHNPLRDVQSIGLITGAARDLIVPDDLTHKARWARAQGHGGVIASHPNALAAVRAIGSDGRIRDHLFSALWHLAGANLIPDQVGVGDHAVMLVGKLEELILQHQGRDRRQPRRLRARDW